MFNTEDLAMLHSVAALLADVDEGIPVPWVLSIVGACGDACDGAREGARGEVPGGGLRRVEEHTGRMIVGVFLRALEGGPPQVAPEAPVAVPAAQEEGVEDVAVVAEEAPFKSLDPAVAEEPADSPIERFEFLHVCARANWRVLARGRTIWCQFSASFAAHQMSALSAPFGVVRCESG